ncbi:hypothetical protein FA95DRAFT_1514086 [Auriscalpium vulgare]|uniref:Uncharacterized protein n=1 Tax=Auriscalpium vulgare TaxID=40419 RepID=A0ACB8S2S1_9AGAM|nr:hypothetical protein FA95DRAFT_1514086 [Auriscalpium vulgare]
MSSSDSEDISSELESVVEEDFDSDWEDITDDSAEYDSDCSTDASEEQPYCGLCAAQRDSTGYDGRLYLPPQDSYLCCHCGLKKAEVATRKLKICCYCREAYYCSKTCQKEHWPQHKLVCGKTTRIDIALFYPFLACLVEISHYHPDTPLHPAHLHTIINLPIPVISDVTSLPSGRKAIVVKLGESIPFEEAMPHNPAWWRTSPCDDVRVHLHRRIGREGHVLPIVTAICLSLLAELYTTTSRLGRDQPPRVRLKYRSHSIVDFGVCKGEAHVSESAMLAYMDSPENIWMGQDPKDHYWIYFKTVLGANLYLDCGLFAFNAMAGVHSVPYSPWKVSELVPAIFVEPTSATARHTTEAHRASVLRSPLLADAVARWRDADITGSLREFMSSLAGKDVGPEESKLAMETVTWQRGRLHQVIGKETWRTWPQEVEQIWWTSDYVHEGEDVFLQRQRDANHQLMLRRVQKRWERRSRRKSERIRKTE